MKMLLVLVLFCGAAFANDRNPQPGPSTNGPATATAASQSNASGGSANTGNAWAVALPGHGSPSYAGNYSICVRGSGRLFNAWWDWAPDLECVKLIAELDRLNRTPVPAAPVALLTEPKCQPPATKAKSVQAAKASGACKG